VQELFTSSFWGVMRDVDDGSLSGESLHEPRAPFGHWCPACLPQLSPHNKQLPSWLWLQSGPHAADSGDRSVALDPLQIALASDGGRCKFQASKFKAM
jgi:hypothetical protein